MFFLSFFPSPNLSQPLEINRAQVGLGGSKEESHRREKAQRESKTSILHWWWGFRLAPAYLSLSASEAVMALGPSEPTFSTLVGSHGYQEGWGLGKAVVSQSRSWPGEVGKQPYLVLPAVPLLSQWYVRDQEPEQRKPVQSSATPHSLTQSPNGDCRTWATSTMLTAQGDILYPALSHSAASSPLLFFLLEPCLICQTFHSKFRKYLWKMPVYQVFRAPSVYFKIGFRNIADFKRGVRYFLIAKCLLDSKMYCSGVSVFVSKSPKVVMVV